MKLSNTKRAMQGFSLVEILIVTSITLTVAGVAIPKIVTTVANVELRGAVHSASGVLQAARMQAIKDNKYRTVRYRNATGGGIVFVDTNNDSLPGSRESQVQLGTTVLAYSAPSGIPELSESDLGFSVVTSTSVSFNTTGQPCTAVNTCGVGMVMYFTDTRVMGAPGWASVSIGPGGRVATWMWSGSRWTSMQ